MNLFDYKELIDHKPMHIATVNSENNPNLAVAADVNVIKENELIISANEMSHTQENIGHNPNVVITVFNKDWVGIRLFGKAKFYTEGEYFDYCKNKFFGHGEVTKFGATEPKGAIVVTVEKVEGYK